MMKIHSIARRAICFIALAGCSGNSTVPAAHHSDILAQQNSVQPHVLTFSRFKDQQPRGSRIYTSDVIVITEHGDGEALPSSIAQLTQFPSGVVVKNILTGETRAFGRAATIATEKGQLVSGLAPGSIATGALELAIACGNAKLAPHDDSIIIPPIGSGGGGDPFTGNGGAGSVGGDLLSSNDQCVSGGENIGWTVNVPAADAGATVTMCAQNSRTSICFSYPNEPAGTHSLSGYLPGSGPASYSMGLLLGDDTQEGVGWGDDPGC
jgi:hypothetical protein